MLIGTFGLVIATFLFETDRSITWNLTAILCLVCTGTIASAVAFVLWIKIISSDEAGKSSITLLMAPIIGTLSAWLLLDEELDLDTIIGILFVISGIIIVNSKDVLLAKSLNEINRKRIF